MHKIKKLQVTPAKIHCINQTHVIVIHFWEFIAAESKGKMIDFSGHEIYFHPRQPHLEMIVDCD